jgi:hypothetical protein
MESYFEESNKNAGTSATPCVCSGTCSDSTCFGGDDSELQAVLVAITNARIAALSNMAKIFIIKNPLSGDKSFDFFILFLYSALQNDNLHTANHIYLIHVYIFPKNAVFHSMIVQNLFYLDLYDETGVLHCIYYNHILNICHLYNQYTFVFFFV